MSSISMKQPSQIGPGNDMDMIKSYGGSTENQESSTMHGSGIAVHTVPTAEINKNPEGELKSDNDQIKK
ncbi:unnamed protein product [Rotaria sordida]|uniref:Uncharacterized protein n=1 Tax=Rotaria sordida TaxID=392033 RepID=A0A815Q9Z3_9BILA|nr:unnamed protein product [Rotaria sordida]CAF1400891.1 unnamed protein product [Rotaria sordida]CAF1460223.1 unnamed protein product [Rotaria sordida]CAF1612152.1 unnamed protein product [Rotaria sordida]CAF3987262.1 unnamed protein product [Rotaria sordida]